MRKNTLNVTDATWETEVLQHEGLVLVDFWAGWCELYKTFDPIIDDIAEEYRGKLKVVKVNTDENHDLTMKYKIIGVPTLMFIKNGNVIGTLLGIMPKIKIQTDVTQYLLDN